MPFIWIVFVLSIMISVVKSVQTTLDGGEKQRSVMRSFKELSHEWHETEGEIGEEHVDRIENEPIKHESPEEGFVILNGIKRRIEDCKNL